MQRLWRRWRLRNKACAWCGESAATIREEQPVCGGCAAQLDDAARSAASAHFDPLSTPKEEVDRFAQALADVFANVRQDPHCSAPVDLVGSVMVAEAALARLQRSVLAGLHVDVDLGMDLDYMRRACTTHWRCGICGDRTAENCGTCDRIVCSRCATGYLKCRDCQWESSIPILEGETSQN